LLKNGSLELAEVSRQVRRVDGRERRVVGHTNGKKPEMSLESWVNNERTGSWVHSGNKLGVLDIFKRKFTLIIPMLIISMLSEKGNGILCVIWISSWHVHVINKVNELSLSLGGIQSTSFLLEILFHDHLKQVGISVEVEIDDLLLVLIRL